MRTLLLLALALSLASCGYKGPLVPPKPATAPTQIAAEKKPTSPSPGEVEQKSPSTESR